MVTFCHMNVITSVNVDIYCQSYYDTSGRLKPAWWLLIVFCGSGFCSL